MPIRYLDDAGREVVLVDTTGLDPEEALDLSRDAQKEVRAGKGGKRFRHIHGRHEEARDEPKYGALYAAEWMQAKGAFDDAQSIALAAATREVVLEDGRRALIVDVSKMKPGSVRRLVIRGSAARQENKNRGTLRRAFRSRRVWTTVIAGLVGAVYGTSLPLLVTGTLALTLPHLAILPQPPKLKETDR